MLVAWTHPSINIRFFTQHNPAHPVYTIVIWVHVEVQSPNFLKKLTVFWSAKSREKHPCAFNASTSRSLNGSKATPFVSKAGKSSGPGLELHLHPCSVVRVCVCVCMRAFVCVCVCAHSYNTVVCVHFGVCVLFKTVLPGRLSFEV